MTEQTTDTTPEITTDTTPETTGTAETVQAAPETTEATEGTPGAEGTPTTPPAWVPNYKYKVQDKELEFDEWAKPFVKDENTKKQFQELYTRAHGLEIHKQKSQELQTKLGNLEGALQYTSQLIQQGTPQATAKFIQALGLPEKLFLDYAIDRFKYQELSPEQRAQTDAQRKQEEYLERLQYENQTIQQSLSHEAKTRKNFEIEQTLGSSEVQNFANMYDTRAGAQGSFKKAMIERGIFHEKVNGVEITAAQAAQEVIQLVGGFWKPGMGTPQNQQSEQAGTIAQNQMDKPVLPTIGRSTNGGSKSPTKKIVNSIADLRERHRQVTAQAEQ